MGEEGHWTCTCAWPEDLLAMLCALHLQEEEEYLIDLMHEEEMAQRRRHDAEAAAAKREAAKREMMAANEGTKLRKFLSLGWESCNTACYTIWQCLAACMQAAFHAIGAAHHVWYLPPLCCCCYCSLLCVLLVCRAAMLRLKAERAAAQRAEEAAFRQSMMAKFAEDDRLEQLNAQKRRLKV
jgi:hypothetical protein